MRCSRRRRRCFKHKLLYFKNTDASHPTPHHPSPTGAVSLRLGHTRGKTTLSCFLRPSCRFATSRGSLSLDTPTLITYLNLLINNFYLATQQLRDFLYKAKSYLIYVEIAFFIFTLTLQRLRRPKLNLPHPLRHPLLRQLLPPCLSPF